jgi:hypothetical protein
VLTGECVRACACVCAFLCVSVYVRVCLYVFVQLCMYCNSELHDEYFRLLAKTRNMVRTLGYVAAVVGRGVIVLAWRGVACSTGVSSRTVASRSSQTASD